MYTQPPNLSPSPTNLPPIPPSPSALSSVSDIRRMPQSLPATPTSVRTFTDFSGEHKRLTTLHGSTGALEVSNLGGFKLSAIAMNGGMNGMGNGNMPVVVGQGSVPMNGKFSGAFESSIDGFVKNGAMSTPTTPLPDYNPMGTSNGMRGVNGLNSMNKTSPPNLIHTPISEVDDEISDVFTTLSVKDPMTAAPGYGRGRSRRSSAPVNTSVQQLWSMGDQGSSENSNGGTMGVMGDMGSGGEIGNLGSSRNYSSSTIPSFNGWNAATTLAPVPISVPLTQAPVTVSSIWSSALQPAVTSQSSRPNSQTSSYSNSSEQGSSSLSAFSPIYSPTNTAVNGFFTHEAVPSTSSLLTSSVSMAETHISAPAFKVNTIVNFHLILHVCQIY